MQQQLNAMQAQQASAATASAAAPPGTPDLTAQLMQLGTLKEQGILSEEEFQAAKAKLLAADLGGCRRRSTEQGTKAPGRPGLRSGRAPTDLAIIARRRLSSALGSRRLARLDRRLPAMVFLTAGIVLGGAVLGWFTVGPSGATWRLIAESTLALVLFTDASRIDLRTLRPGTRWTWRGCRHWAPLTIVAGGGCRPVTLPG